MDPVDIIDSTRENAHNLELTELSVADIADAVAKLEQDILALRQQQVALLARHNELMPVNKLPPEIFSQIFEYCVYWKDRPSVWWLNLLHVCSAWRKIIFHDPRLWARPVFQRPYLAQFMMKHAQDVPLEVYTALTPIHSPRPSSPIAPISQRELVRYALSRPNNVGTIDLHIPYTSINDYLLIITDAPALQRLCAKNSHWRLDEHNINTQTPPQINAPQLQKLELYGFIFPLVEQPIPRLTVLTINNSCAGRGYLHICIPLSRVLDVLREAPALRCLELVAALRWEPTNSPSSISDPLPIIHMNKLTACILDDNLDTGILELACCLHMPSLRHSHIGLMTTRVLGREEIGNRFGMLQKFCSSWGKEPWRILTLRGRQNMMVKLETFQNIEVEPKGWGSDVEPWMELHLKFLLEGYHTDYLESFADAFALDKVKTLRSDVPHCWEVLPQFLSSLSEVHIYSEDAVNFIAQLLEYNATSPFVHLNSIKFIDIELDEYGFFKEESIGDALVSALIICRNSGMPLHKISFQDCTGLEDIQEELSQKLGQEVAIDVYYTDDSETNPQWESYYGSAPLTNDYLSVAF